MITTQPLKKRKILLTRAANQLGNSKKLFENLGAKVFELPSLVIGPPDTWDPLDQALEDLESFHWIIFSSANGINAVQQRLNLKNKSLAEKDSHLKIGVVGRKTYDHLNDLGVQADYIPPEFNADSLINNFPVSSSGLKILIPRVQSGGRTILSEFFTSSGAEVIEVASYETTCPDNLPQLTINALESNEIDAITFTSSKIVSYSYKLLKNYFNDSLETKIAHMKFISIGPQTSLSCQKYFKRVDEEAKPHDMEGLAQACIRVFR